jgi:hypothetical protein
MSFMSLRHNDQVNPNTVGAAKSASIGEHQMLFKASKPVYKTEVIMDNLNPSWAEIKLGIQSTCAGNVEGKIIIEIDDWDADGSHDPLGYVVTSWCELEAAAESGTPMVMFHPNNLSAPSARLDVSSCAACAAHLATSAPWARPLTRGRVLVHRPPPLQWRNRGSASRWRS